MISEEHKRLSFQEIEGIPPWKKWGAYVSERSWGTVREDYSSNGDAWNFLTHDMARSKAYRWGEDGIAGFCDYFQTMAFSFAFWNGKDPILKERLFGLNPYEGNHGEDVKECYYYLDATPSQSYLKFLYKYPHEAFPYETLIQENQKRSSLDREFEIYDTGIFDEGRYFDVFVEYAKADTEDFCIKVEVHNRGKLPAFIHLIPQLLFRNRWSWGPTITEFPVIKMGEKTEEIVCVVADPSKCAQPLKVSYPYDLSPMYLYGKTPQEVLFTNNETHAEKLYGENAKSVSVFVKDAFHRYIIEKEPCVHFEEGTKVCFHYGPIEVEPGTPYVLLLRFSANSLENPLQDVEKWIAKRKEEADLFYKEIHPPGLREEEKLIQRTAFAGMIWGQQFYVYDVKQWLKGDNPLMPPPPGRGDIRNGHWMHLAACNVISMPDKWEYPWFAAWDLCFHAVTLSLVDIPLAKRQLTLLLQHWFQHVNGQIPAYEWAFSDLNPPVQAWAFWKVYQREEDMEGKGDREFLLFGFLKLVENFSWWVNKVDRFGNNLFEGGFLGLDNISVIDRSTSLPEGGVIEQSDATGWMGFYALTMMRIALELAKEEPTYEDLATNFFEQFVYISKNMHGALEMWDEKDGFFYDLILKPDGTDVELKIRSFVGIIPFYSLTFIDEEELKNHTRFYERLLQFREVNQEEVDRCVLKTGSKRMFSLIDVNQISRIFSRVFDPDEFLSDYGLRSISKFHEKNPLRFGNSVVGYEPGESPERIKGGNSNWRGPIWFPTNYLFIDALHKLIECLGTDFSVEMKDGSRKELEELHQTLKKALLKPFCKNDKGVLPVHGDTLICQNDPFFKDLLLFYEHYHGDTGRGLGASHQTGWSGLIANIIGYLIDLS